MKTLHIVPELNEANGVFVVANLIAREQGDAEVVSLNEGLSKIFDKTVEEVWGHGMWLPKQWLACKSAIKLGKRLVRMTHGSLSPIYLKRQSPLKKSLVGFIERYYLRKADKIVATCEAERKWIQKYLHNRNPEIEVTDIKRYFDLRDDNFDFRSEERKLNFLYLGRRHPLKGLDLLEEAIKDLEGVEFKIVSNVFGEDKERIWDWCDVLMHPTLSENFGLVVAEALQRGKCAVTTHGAPAWHIGNENDAREIRLGYGGKLLYLNGYSKLSREDKINFLKDAINHIRDKIKTPG
jgi:glycosyltransferase involved in cell wall biosynthesis